MYEASNSSHPSDKGPTKAVDSEVSQPQNSCGRKKVSATKMPSLLMVAVVSVEVDGGTCNRDHGGRKAGAVKEGECGA